MKKESQNINPKEKKKAFKEESIFVNRPDLPSLEDFIPLLEDIWRSKKLTNSGKFHIELEKKLAEFLGVKYVSLFANGTLALIASLQVLDIRGEVITTPYSFVATTHAIKWNGSVPVFCDINSANCNLKTDNIEKLITKKTSAIMPVHVYGNPCDVKKIQKIAASYGLKVIYDAAHAFGVKLNGKSILNFGDLSVLSFHATKVYNTFEGGAVICHDSKTKEKLDYFKNFAFAGETTVVAPGINAKMNELQAAIGLLQLKKFNENRLKRKEIAEIYKNELQKIEGINFIKTAEKVEYNYGYFPIFIDNNKYGISRNKLYFKLKENRIFARRYFYPLISDFSPYKNLKSAKPERLKNARQKAKEVICLPVYNELEKENLNKIISILKDI